MKKLILILLIFIFTICASQNLIETYNLQSTDGTYKNISHSSQDFKSINTQDRLVRTDNQGHILWEQIIKTETLFDPESNTQDGWVVAGYTTYKDGKILGNPDDYDYWIIKVLPLNINTYYNDSPVYLYPNPLYSQTYLYVSKEYLKGYSILINDALGRFIKNIPITQSITLIEREQMPPGTYFYSIQSDKKQGPKGKFIIL